MEITQTIDLKILKVNTFTNGRFDIQLLCQGSNGGEAISLICSNKEQFEERLNSLKEGETIKKTIIISTQ